MATTKESELSARRSGGSGNLAIVAAKFLLWLLCWGIAAFYAMLWIVMPTKTGGKFYTIVYYAFEYNKQWGGPGAYILMFSGPFIVLAVVACLYLELEKAYPSRRKAPKHRNGWLRRVWDSLWTQPLVVRGPLGMMSTIEILGLAMVIIVTLWQFFKYLLDYFKEIDAGETMQADPRMTKQMQKFEYVSVMLGWVALVPLALLFVPVTRGSSILKLIDIPFEHAVKYHVWLGHITMLLVTAHGVSYGIYYGVMDEAHMFVKWQKNGIANLPGVIALVAGLLMWPTSLAYIRRRFFNVFFSVHQLYIVFFAFTVWHLGILLSGYFFGGIFLFFIDRFLRFIQSRRAIKNVTATVLPTGIVQLKLPVSPGPSYTPLSFMFLNFRGLAKLEWHPFSVSSTPLDDTRFMSILIKPLGDWTEKLQKSVEDNSGGSPERQAPAAAGCPLSLKLFAEGPYGHESNYYLHYKHVLLVAGGIGVTPFMAITQDILHRYQMGQEGLPTTLDLIWCVKNRSELLAFKDHFCDPARIFSGYGSSGSDFQVNVKVFLTAEKGATTADEVASELQASKFAPQALQAPAGYGHNTAVKAADPGVDFGGSGSNLLIQAAVITAASLGLTLFLALFRVYVYLPHSDIVEYTKELLGWIDALLFLVSIAVGIVVFGGAVMGGVRLASRNKGESKSAGGNGVQSIDLHHVQNAQDEKLGHLDIEESGLQHSLLQRAFITTGTRPNFNEIFNDIREQNGKSGADVAVLVCGPEAMAETVAEQCRSQNFGNVWINNYSTHFHYHSVSFDL